MARTRKPNRAAFTLIELMAVIAIIAVLIALLLPAVYKALGFGAQAVARHELSQLESGIQSFSSKFGVDYIPSKIKLCKYYSTYNLATQLDKDSVIFLLKCWPKMYKSDGTGNWSVSGINWHPNWTTITDTTTTSAAQATLEGHQCLVYFLGGVPIVGTPNAVTGFSTNPANPADTTSTIARTQPFFEFQNKRLGTVGTSIFLSYADPIGSPAQPYAYFSSFGNSNGYNRYGSSDNPSLISPDSGVAIVPYSLSGTSPTQYLKPDRFQIICAGADGAFGGGGAWSVTGAGTSTSGKDDLSNFTTSTIGKGE